MLWPKLDFDLAETPLSFAARLAAFHTGGRLIPFLNDLGIPAFSLQKGTEEALARLCSAAGADLASVSGNAVIALGERRYMFRGEVFSSELLSSPETVFCPACLAEDGGDHNPGASRMHRVAWLFRPYATCSEHSLALASVAREDWSDQFNELAVRLPHDRVGLIEMAKACEERTPSPLQEYMMRRFYGQASSPWLDGLTIEQAVRTTEMLGAAIKFGAKQKLSQMDRNRWDQAGRVGFDFTNRGIVGVREALDAVLSQTPVNSRSHGPSRIYGFLHEWLRERGKNKTWGPMQSILREHILQNLPIEPGEEVLGEVVSVRRFYTVNSCAKEFNLDPRTLKNFLKTAGGSNWTQRGIIDLSTAQQVAAAMKDTINLVQLPKLLRCGRPLAEELAKKGRLPKLGASTQGSNFAKAFSRPMVAEWMVNLLARAKLSDHPVAGTLPISDAAEVSRLTSYEIVQLLESGKLTQAIRLTGVEGLASLRFDPIELRRYRRAEPEGHRLDVAAKLLRISYATLVVITQKDIAGPRLRVNETANLSGGMSRRILDRDLEAFRREYISAGEICHLTGLHPSALKKVLAQNLVRAVVVKSHGITPIYACSELPDEILQVLGDRTRQTERQVPSPKAA